MNVREFFEQRVEENPEKVYLYFENQRVTYEVLSERATQVAPTPHYLFLY
jgi:hypothetical protein